MALITDPDNLSQGTSTSATNVTFTIVSGNEVTIADTVGTTLPSITAGAYFEIRDANSPENNGLYVETGGSPTTSSITATKVAGANNGTPIADATASVGATFLHTESTLNDEKSVYFDFYTREIWLLKQGNLSDDGATLQSIYSFTKEEWKNDAELIYHPFPFIAITPEQFETQEGWIFHEGTDAASIGAGDTVQDTETRKLVRTGGWREIAANGTLNREYVGVITLGNFEDNVNDLAYFQQGNDPTDTAAAQDFTFNGPVNEAINSYDYTTTSGSDGIGTSYTLTTSTITRPSGSFITDGYKIGGKVSIVTASESANLGTGGIPKDFTITNVTATVLTVSESIDVTTTPDTALSLAVNNRNVLNVFLRSDYLFQGGDTTGKTYAQQSLADIGAETTGVDNKVFRFPLSNVLDLNITENDTNIGAGAALDSSLGDYADIVVKYFDGAFSRDVDLDNTPRSFGIVIEVGVHCGIDSSTAVSTLTSNDGGINDRGANYYDGGKLIIHEGADKGTYDIVSHTDTTVVVSQSFTGDAGGDNSFTVQREDDVDVRTSATTKEIYEAIQYRLRQDANINTHNTSAVVGSTADALLRFVGTELEAGQATPTNPNGGGSGVIIEGLLDHTGSTSNDYTFFDNSGTARTFPFVASGTINFNNNLFNDSNAQFWMFFTYTKRTTSTNFAVTDASVASTYAMTLTGSADLPVVVDNQYIRISGFTEESNNGLYRVNDPAPTTSAIDLIKVDGLIPVDEVSGDTVNVDENPIDSPEAIIVNDNDGNPLTGSIPAAVNGISVRSFTFDYDNNEQGERDPGDGDAAVTIRAIGFDTAAFVETTGTISQTGNAFSLVAALERNYSNAA